MGRVTIGTIGCIGALTTGTIIFHRISAMQALAQARRSIAPPNMSTVDNLRGQLLLFQCKCAAPQDGCPPFIAYLTAPQCL